MIIFQYITIKKSNYTNNYIVSEPMNYNFYLLHLLLNDEKLGTQNWSIFCKNTSISCWATSQVFIHKNNKNIELFSIHDINSEDLALPKSPKFSMTTKNFLQFMMQVKNIQVQCPQQAFIAIDQNGTVHLTADLASIQNKTFFDTWQYKISKFFRAKK